MSLAFLKILLGSLTLYAIPFHLRRVGENPNLFNPWSPVGKKVCDQSTELESNFNTKKTN